MDIALTKDEGHSIIELSSINCSGLYNCDVVPIVAECNYLAQREWEEMYG